MMAAINGEYERARHFSSPNTWGRGNISRISFTSMNIEGIREAAEAKHHIPGRIYQIIVINKHDALFD